MTTLMKIKTKHNKNWPYTPDHPYRILIIGGLIENQPEIGKIYLYAKTRMKQNINV